MTIEELAKELVKLIELTKRSSLGTPNQTILIHVNNAVRSLQTVQALLQETAPPLTQAPVQAPPVPTVEPALELEPTTEAKPERWWNKVWKGVKKVYKVAKPVVPFVVTTGLTGGVGGIVLAAAPQIIDLVRNASQNVDPVTGAGTAGAVGLVIHGVAKAAQTVWNSSNPEPEKEPTP